MLFIILTETWLRDHLDAEVKVHNYTLFRTDRSRPKKRRGRNSGGVAVYLRDNLAASSEVLFQHSDGGVIEILCVIVRRLNLVICAVYRPPDDPIGGNRSTSRELSSSLGKLAQILTALPTPTPDIIVSGDFNLPKVSWPSCVPGPGATRDEREMISVLSCFSSEFFLEQQIVGPTHQAGNTLDLILTNNPELIASYDITPTAPVSSHYMIRCTTPLSNPQFYEELPENQSKFDDFNLLSDSTSWENINSELRLHDWDSLFAGLSPSRMLEELIMICEDAVSRNSPKRKRFKTQRPIIPRHRKILMRKRTKIRKKFLCETHPDRKFCFQNQLTEIEKQLQTSYKSQRDHDEQKTVETIKTNPKYFYSYARDK